MTVHAPVSDFAAARQAMVDSQLRPEGVSDPSVIAAMSIVPREKFVPDDRRPLAYVDRAIPLGEGRSMPAPMVTGLLLTALAPHAGESALVVGAGTGYAATILAEMGVKAVALESSATLVAAANKLRVRIVEGALEDGHLPSAPYDFILIDGAVEFIPDALVEQLKDGGRLAGAIIGEGGITRLFVGRKAGGGFGFHSIADSATPALPGFERPRTFTF
jgi:protein-L-isoaspartate(D-aspartate) O-methyltransferase